MEARFEDFVDHLAQQRRVIVLDGLAVISHGLSRPTKDADIWLEPLATPSEWATHLRQTLAAFPTSFAYCLTERRNIRPDEIDSIIESDRVLRIKGLTPDLDIFRIPNNIEQDQFDEIWNECQPTDSSVRVMNDLHLIVTKAETGRTQDQNDILFLEAKVRRDMSAALLTATPDQANALFDRYIDHAVLTAALTNPHETVRARALTLLQDLAASGDPFARDAITQFE